MVIIGAGMAGCLAAMKFKDAQIMEPLAEPTKHKAVLRFRSDKVSKLSGIPFKEVTVHKGVFDVSESKFIAPNIRVANEYSRKVTGKLGDRSIWNVEPVKRFIAPENFHELMLERLKDRIDYGSNVKLYLSQSEASDPVISTIPMTVMMGMLGVRPEFEFIKNSSPIYVTTVKIKDCELYQTIYFTRTASNVYRASITGDTLSVESMHPMHRNDLRMVYSAFDISAADATVIWNDHKQTVGKIVNLPDEQRKQLLFKMSDEFGVYSLGRLACWRNILLDDVVQDLERINQMINQSAYDRMLGKK